MAVRKRIIDGGTPLQLTHELSTVDNAWNRDSPTVRSLSTTTERILLGMLSELHLGFPNYRGSNLDLILGISPDRNRDIVLLGHWNDGTETN